MSKEELIMSEDKQNEIESYGDTKVIKNNSLIRAITIIGQIEGHTILPSNEKATKYEHIIPMLVDIEEDDDTKGVLIILNTAGGDVEAGLAIAEMISTMKKPTVSLVLGGGHSIGVPLAVSAKKSFIAKSAAMTVHPVRMNGLVIGVPQSFWYFDKIQERIVNFVEGNSNISKERFLEIMHNKEELVSDVGSILNGEEAVKEGLIDYVGGLSDAMTCLYEMIKNIDKS
ncbi:MAG: ATP-dependent Clp protease proteolytic subunit [Clostridia bacterium]|nr:ATP-dependent Clp protease proteolytic subunit [Clostridia bacterium]